MPLLKGKKNFGHNVKAEMEAGKPQKQALAIAYDKMGEKKMNKGGEVEPNDETGEICFNCGGMMNEGGIAEEADDFDDESVDSSPEPEEEDPFKKTKFLTGYMTSRRLGKM